jgi:hypothetical protein
MIIAIFILTLLNTVGLGFILINKFNETFMIVKKEVYDELINYWTEHHDDEGNELGQELAGGVGVETGFFREELYDDEGEEEDE